MDPRLEPFAQRAAQERAEFLKALRAPRESQAKFLLEQCVAPNQDTSFGREHGFGQVRTVEEYRRAVPIRAYHDIEPWIERSASGESAVLTQKDPVSFSRTSGTTGSAKKIPITEEYQRRHELRRMLLGWANTIAQHPEAVERADSAWRIAGDAKAGGEKTAAGVPYLAVTQRIRWGEAENMDPVFRSSPGRLAPWRPVPPGVEGDTNRLYFKLRGTVEHDLRAILTINPSTLVRIAQILAESSAKLVAEVQSGTALGQPLYPPNPVRAEVLARLLATHGTLLPLHLWPGLTLIQCWKSASCSLYLPRVQTLYGPDVEILPNGIAASEGSISVPIDRHPVGAPLTIDSTFFEFVPADRDVAPGGTTLLFDELTVGAEYEIVMTQSSGLYRYAIGDVVRVLERIGEVPRVEFVGRKGVFSSFTGEKLTEAQVVRAVEEALAACAVRTDGVTCCPVWGEPPRYAMVVEGDWDSTVLTHLAQELERQLCLQNDEYPGKRSSGRLGPIELHLVAPGTFARRRERLVGAGAASAQLKESPLQKDAAALNELSALSAQPVVRVEAR